MSKCDVTVLVSASGIAVKDLLDSRPTRHLLIPDLDELLEAKPVQHYPYNKTYEEAKFDPYLILHSSGTTGFPKPIRMNHAAAACLDAHSRLPDVDEKSGLRRSFLLNRPGPQRILLPFLHFHGIASLAMMVSMVFGGGVYVNGFRHRILERGDLFNVLDNTKVDAAFFSPALIEDLAANPESPKYLKKISQILYGGGKFVVPLAFPS